MIDALLQALTTSDLPLTDEEFADVLWLASYMDMPSNTSTLANAPELKSQPATPSDAQNRHQQSTKAPQAADTSSQPTASAQAEVHLPRPSTHDKQRVEGMRALSFRSPAATALPGKLALARALRPILRKIPSSTQQELDEVATAEQAAEEGRIAPQLRPGRERWLDVAVVIDDWQTMAIWQQTIAEFIELLQQLGAFRTLQTYLLSTNGDGQTEQATLQLFTAQGFKRGRICPPGELVDPRGRRLTLVLTDCTSPAWSSGAAGNLLSQWGNRNMVTLVQMLPADLWNSCALADAIQIAVSAPAPGIHNAKLAIERPWYWDDIWDEDRKPTMLSQPMPIITLEPEPLRRWTQTMVSKGGSKTAAFYLSLQSLPSFSLNRQVTSEILSPEERWQRFRATASPIAQELVGYLSAAPLNLSVMRLVQRVMLPQSRQVHLAEILRSNLIYTLPKSDPIITPDETQYEFGEGIRKLLLTTMLLNDSKKVLETVSEYISRCSVTLRQFHALILDPTSLGSFTVDEQHSQFAHVTTQVLRRLGGDHALLAGRLEQQITEIDREAISPSKITKNITPQTDPQNFITSTSSLSGSLSPLSEYERKIFEVAIAQTLLDVISHFQILNLSSLIEALRDISLSLPERCLRSTLRFPTVTEFTEQWLARLRANSPILYTTDFERVTSFFLDRLKTYIENLLARYTEDSTRHTTSRVNELHNSLVRLTTQLQEELQSSTEPSPNSQDRTLLSTLFKYIVNGLSRLVIDYSARIQGFLVEHLGSNRMHVPFGGRVAELRELNAWLDDPNAPPYYLLTAEAGRGKSALVCHWLLQLIVQQNIDIAFIPVSIRFETATQDVVFAALAARLAAIHGETIPAAAFSADQWRAICDSYLLRQPLDGKQLLIILDGLDEATGWTPGRGLFPSDPPNGLRVLVTARQRAGEIGPQGWATVLSWGDDWLARKAMLSGLNRMGMQEALVSMGNPLGRLATQSDVVGELYRLTEGDPLLLRLYIEALIGKGVDATYLRAKDLATLQTGLYGYFERWWRDQHKQWRNEGRDPLVEEEQLLILLNAMAAALGPLTQDDLAAVSNLTDSLLVRHLLQTIGRWIIGDGKTQGYSFSHPRLGYYFWEQLSIVEQAEWDTRFTAWGARTLDALNRGTLGSRTVPSYLLHHYCSHLVRSAAPAAQFYALISNGWRKAWSEIDISYRGFLNDIDRTRAKALWAYTTETHDKAETLVQVVKAALCHASIVALTSQLTPEFLALVVSQKLLTPSQALSIIHSMHDKPLRARMLAALAPHLPSSFLAEALSAALAISNESDRAETLTALAPHLPPPLLAEALAAVLTLGGESYRAKALIDLVPHLPSSLLAETLTAARAIEDESYRVNALAALAPHLPEGQQSTLVAEALTAARTIKNESYRAKALVALAPYLPERQRSTLLTEALMAVRAIGDESYRANALAALAPHLPASFLTEALAAVLTIGSSSYRASALADLAPHLPSSLLTEALTAARAIEDESYRANALAALAPHLPASFLTEALAAVLTIGSSSYRASALADLAPHLPGQQRLQVLTEALAVAQTISSDSHRASVLAVLAPQLPEKQRLQVLTEALAAAQIIGDKQDRNEVLSKLVPYLSKEEGTNILVAHLTPEQHTSTSSKVAQPLVYNELQDALAAVRVTVNPSDRVLSLASLTSRLVQWGKSSPQEALSELDTTLDLLCHRPRPEFLNDLAALIPFIMSLTSDDTESAARGISHALAEVSSWWP